MKPNVISSTRRLINPIIARKFTNAFSDPYLNNAFSLSFSNNFSWFDNFPKDLDINQRSAIEYGNYGILHILAMKGKFDVCEELIRNHNADINIRNIDKYRPLEVAVFSQNDPKDFLKKFLPQKTNKAINSDDIDKFINVVEADFFVKLFYSLNGFPTYNEIFFNFLNNVVPKTSIDKTSKDLIIKVIDSIKTEQPIKTSNREINLFLAQYFDHTAYFLIDKQKQDFINKNSFLSYCDGNIPTDYENSAEIIYNIDSKKVDKLGVELGKFLRNPDNFGKYNHFFENNGQNLKNILSKIVYCNSQNQPEIIDRRIPISRQSIENCVVKSFFILFRAISQKINPEMEFGYDKNDKPLKGQEKYDKNKLLLRRDMITRLIENSTQDQEGSNHHNIAINSLEMVLFKAIKNGDHGIIEIADKALKENGFSYAKQDNFFKLVFAIENGTFQEETLNFLVENTDFAKDIDESGDSFVTKFMRTNEYKDSYDILKKYMPKNSTDKNKAKNPNNYLKKPIINSLNENNSNLLFKS